ncbi:BatA domain-containing protein [Komagataeibacter rhaeticus]|nr:BatA domain-containing protein [Komagataeibacter rhaeticus]
MMLLAPWLLVGLAALPVIWWLLHALPPAPRPQSFPPASLLRALDATRRIRTRPHCGG